MKQRKLFLTDGKDGKRPFISMILSTDKTGVMDRGYQAHNLFDRWQARREKSDSRILGSSGLVNMILLDAEEEFEKGFNEKISLEELMAVVARPWEFLLNS